MKDAKVLLRTLIELWSMLTQDSSFALSDLCLFGNRGPAGNHPFGDAFRVTIESLDEASGTITLGLRFRWCQRSWFVDLGCTPYITPPLPLVVLQEKSAIPYAVPNNTTANTPISISKPFSQ